jgi:enamine deaminase RidA (YjgF/YER057c/UK114 family)
MPLFDPRPTSRTPLRPLVLSLALGAASAVALAQQAGHGTLPTTGAAAPPGAATTTPREEPRARAPRVERINPDALMKPTGYTHVVRVEGGRLVFVAGQVALDKAGNVVGKGDLGAQARQVFANLESALAAAGASPKDVVKLVIYVVGYDSSRIPLLREARQAFLAGAEPPASTLVGVQALAREDFLIEIEAYAAVP